MGPADYVLTLAVIATLAALLQALASRLAIPHSVLLALLGIGLGGLAVGVVPMDDGGALSAAAARVATFDPGSEAILTIFLPVLLFQTGLTLDVRRVIDDIAPILLLAIVAVLVCLGAVGAGLWLVSDQTLVVCLLLGAIVATTDPVAVVGIFRDVGAPRRLSVLVEGESLFNDAAAIVAFGLLLDLLTVGAWAQVGAGDGAGSGTGVGAIVGLFVWSFVGGAVFGFGFARLGTWCIGALKDLPLAQTTLTVALAYACYILAERLGVSGVVAVVMAALVVGSVGRTRFSPATWQRLDKVWDQLGFWASVLVFVFASALVPRFLADISFGAGWLWLILAVTAAAFAARALVLWGLFPLLTAMGLGERISHAYRLVIWWGGLRGAVTLALALAVAEHPGVPAAVREFVGILATAFVLVTLFVNAPTLRAMLRLLHLDRLAPIDRAVRDRAIALALDEVDERIGEIADHYHISTPIRERLSDAYQRRRERVGKSEETALGWAQQIGLGLISLANREEELYLRHFADGTVSRPTLLALLGKAARLRDGAKEAGIAGYRQAARDSRRFRRSFRLAALLHRRLGWQGPLAARLAGQFEMLLVTRIVLDRLRVYLNEKLAPLVAPAVADELAEALSWRRQSCVERLEEMKLQYADYAETLEERFLRTAALRLEAEHYRVLFDERAISQEVLRDLSRGLDTLAVALEVRPRLALGLDKVALVRRFPMFAELSRAEIAEITQMLKVRFAYPGERLMLAGERGDFMLFIASGTVEVMLERGRRVRLKAGDFVGEMALLFARRRSADVTAVTYCRLLQLNGQDFRRFLRTHPALRERIRAVADARQAGRPEVG